MLTHWPGIPCPDGLTADTSAEMAFRYLDRGAADHGAAEVVTNKRLLGLVVDHLETSPAAFNPYA